MIRKVTKIAKIARIALGLSLSASGLQAVYADDSFNAGFDQGIKSAFLLQTHPMQAIQNFKPEQFIQGYQSNPKETNYRGNTGSIKTDAVTVRQNDPTAQSIQSSINNHPVFPINPDLPEIRAIQKRSDDVYDVLTNQFSSCTKQTQCTTRYQTQTCEEPPKNTFQHCNKTLNINVVSNETHTDYSFSVSFSTRWHNYAAAIFNLTTGEVINGKPDDLVASLTGRLPSAIDLSTLSLYSKDNDAYISALELSDHNVNIRVSNYPRHATIHFVIRVTTTTLSPTDQWSDDCTGLANTGRCRMTEERCVDGSSTHVVQGLSVTRDCWEKEATYSCGAMGVPSTCEPLRDQGCEQINSECENQVDSVCLKYKQTLRCPIKQCTDVGMVCNNQTYCLSGDCVKKQNQADPDFQRAVSALSVANEAAKSFSQFNSIFKGERKICDTFALGFLNCCADTGWGKDHLANCTQEEKDLKIAKDNLLTVYVGEFCKKDVLGHCFEKRKAYCVFPSKLARIIQDQGRRGQLSVGFGNPEDTDCRGITREEFATLNFNAIDFSDFYSEIYKKEKIEDQEKLNNRIINKVKSLPEGVGHG